MGKYYIAYGSNLNFEQMKKRCPDAEFVGTSKLNNYELLFRGSKENAVATVESCEGKQTPVGVWYISDRDETYLDHYEGFPNFYTKKNMLLSADGVQTKAMLYVMTDGHELGKPNINYYNAIKQGYKDCKLEVSYLEESVNKMNQLIEEIDMKEQYPMGYKDVRI